MARLHGHSISTLTLGGQSLLTDTVSIDVPQGANVHDTTTMGDSWEEFTAGLKKGGDVKHKLFYDNANTTGTFAYLSGKIGVETALIVSDGTRTVACSVIVTEAPFAPNVSEMVMIDATYRVSASVVSS